MSNKKRAVRVTIECGAKHCDPCQYEYQPMVVWFEPSCSLFCTKNGEPRKLYGDPTRRCRQCIEGEEQGR